MKHLWIPGMIVLAFFLWSKAYACTRDELEMVHIISNHGSFSPPFVYPKDSNPAAVWTEGLNDLTMLGKFQSYALGAFLRNFYGDFISSDPRELEVFSSSDKGIVKSAQSLVAALYSPSSYWEVVQNFKWQPIYINYDTNNYQFLSKRQCPAANEEYKRVILKETGALLQTYQNFILYWSMNSGMNLKNIVDVEDLFQILFTEFTHNLTTPAWSQIYWNEMKYLHDVSVSLRTNSAKLIRLQGGPLVNHTTEIMREKAFGDTDPRKVIVYTPHTIPMEALLAALDLGNFGFLPPCATLLLELYKREGEHFVRYLYLNSTLPQREPQEIYSLRMPGCSEFCPLDYVIEHTRNVIPKNLVQECLLI